MRQTVVGVFDKYAAAQRAADAVAAQGIARDHIHVTGATDEDEARDADLSQHEGVVGSIRSFFAEVFGADEHEHVSQYAEAVRRGGALVKVDVDEDDEADEAREALQSAGAIDIEERLNEWRASGASSLAQDDASLRAGQADAARSDEVIPVIKEDLEVGKREVGTGGVRVYARTLDVPVQESIDLRSERATVERRAVDRPATEADLAALQDRTIEVRETAERPVIAKTARVVEEVVVGKQVSHEQQTVQDTVRQTEVEVERLSGDQRDVAPYDDYANEFRSHFDATYGRSDSAFDDFEPAYRYGHSLASDRRYAGRRFEDFEPEARQQWETSNPGSTWEKVKASVRHAWDRVTR
ncbi:MAG TPA: YsnF/AvaK domain-containing protein [Burkholderiaceae bacterium]|nr:YsnF/AvaK domain-containing protein [Burkholderiaceae bacterium]